MRRSHKFALKPPLNFRRCRNGSINKESLLLSLLPVAHPLGWSTNRRSVALYGVLIPMGSTTPMGKLEQLGNCKRMWLALTVIRWGWARLTALLWCLEFSG